VTGASKGIGKAIARELASRGYDLLLVARTASELERTAAELKDSFPVKTAVLALDLSVPGSAQAILDYTRQHHLPVSVLVNNAGYGLWGNFHELSLKEQNEMLQVNVLSLVDLCHLFVSELRQHQPAYILNVASTTAYQAIPTLGLYAASKSLVVSFTRSLRYELKPLGIRVSCLSPGTTRTDFVQRGRMEHMQKLSDKMAMEPEAVAKIAVKGLFRGQAEIIPGFSNRFSAALIPLLPKQMIENIAAGIYKKKK